MCRHLLAFHIGEVCDIVFLARRNKKRAVSSKRREIYPLNHIQKTRQTYAVPEREGRGRCKAAFINYIVRQIMTETVKNCSLHSKTRSVEVLADLSCYRCSKCCTVHAAQQCQNRPCSWGRTSVELLLALWLALFYR